MTLELLSIHKYLELFTLCQSLFMQHLHVVPAMPYLAQVTLGVRGGVTMHHLWLISLCCLFVPVPVAGVINP